MSAFDDAIATRTVWGEARGDGAAGMLAVAYVIRNRLQTGRWGTRAASVCLAPFQFSAWNPNDPNRKQLIELSESSPGYSLASTAWEDSDNPALDPTKGATFYRVIGTPAAWANGHVPVATIGRHEFFKGIA